MTSIPRQVIPYLPQILGTIFFLVCFWIFKRTKIALFSPLSEIPGPALNRWTGFPLWISSVRLRKMHYVHSLHQNYGPVVRTSPTTVSFSSPESVKSIHKIGSGFRKSPFYEAMQLRGTLVSLIDTKEHSSRRKYFAKAFSQQNLLEWEDVIKGKVELAISKLKDGGKEGEEVDILRAFSSMATDVVAELCFGDAFKSGTSGDSSQKQESERAAVIQGIQTEIPLPHSQIARNLPFYLKALPPPLIFWVLRNPPGTSNTESLSRDKLRIIKKQHTLLTKALVENEEGFGLSDDVIIKECKAFIVAGTDTTGVTTTYVIWAVLKHPEVKVRLQKELDSLLLGFSITDVQSLKYLHCVINEALRLYGAASSSLPRTTPRDGRQLGGYFIPEKTTVETQAFTLHRNPEIFEDPEKFVPDRWYNPTEEMKEAFMPFSIGSRVCIGIQLALMEIALTTAVFFRECPDARIGDSMKDADMEMDDVFVTTLRGHKCKVFVL